MMTRLLFFAIICRTLQLYMVKLKNAAAFFLTLCYRTTAASGLTQDIDSVTAALTVFFIYFIYTGDLDV